MLNGIGVAVGIVLMGIGSPELYAMSEATTGAGATDTTKPVFVTPRIEGYGAIMPLPQAAVPPQAGSRVVFDIAGAGQPDQVLKGLNSIASFLNLAAEAGIAADSFHLTAVLHGPATAAVLRKEAYEKERKTPANPNLALIRNLKSAGVELYVCGQALAHHRYALEDVTPEVTVAVSAVTVTVSKQMAGYAYLPYY